MPISHPHNPLLRRFWFRTKQGRGIGVTAFSKEDAEQLIRDAAQATPWLNTEVLDVVEDVDLRHLDQGHVIPNMNPPTFRGIWFPRLGPL